MDKKIIFLTSNPIEKDLFEGKSHERIAQKIKEIIYDEEVENRETRRQVIGLEGGWGSGKSTVVNILNKKLGEDGFVFLYDVWSFQDNLNNVSFLDELMVFLESKEINNFENKGWGDKIKKLYGKTIKTNVKKRPKINYSLFFSVLFYFLLKMDNYYLLKKFLIKLGAGINKKVFWEITLWFVIIMFFFMKVCYKKYIKKSKNKFKDLLEEEFGSLICFYQGKESEIKNEEIIIEGQARSKDFRNHLNDINKLLDNKNKKVVIVFDNLDRLPKDKIRQVWATIHTFFAESVNNKKNKNIWVIIPYDKSKVEKAFDEGGEDNNENNGFISKTLEINFRISEPILSDWKNYFNIQIEKLDYIFDNLFNKEIEIKELRNIFDKAERKKTPRKINSFLNDIMALKISNYSNDISLKYYGLFRYLNWEISESMDILKEIKDFQKEEIKNLSGIFKYDEEWRKYISAIYFNIDKDRANEVLIYEDLKKSIQLNDEEIINKMKNYSYFWQILEKVITDLISEDTENDWKNILNSILKIEKIEENIPEINKFYEKLSEDAIAASDKNDDKEFLQLIKKVRLKTKKKLTNKILELNREEKPDRQIEDYLSIVDRIKEIDSKLIKFPRKLTLNKEDSFKVLELKEGNYKNYGIKLNVEQAEEDILKRITNKTISKEDYTNIKILLNESKLEKISQNLKQNNYYQNYSYYFNRLDDFYYILISKLFIKKEKDEIQLKSLMKFVTDSYNGYIKNKIKDISLEIKEEIMVMLLASGRINNEISCEEYTKFLNENTNLESRAKKLVEYISYKELMELFLKSETKVKVLNGIVCFTVENSLYNEADTAFLFSDQYCKIKEMISNSEEIDLNFINIYRKDIFKWKEHLKDIKKESVCLELLKDVIENNENGIIKILSYLKAKINWHEEMEKDSEFIELLFIKNEKLKEIKNTFKEEFENFVNNKISQNEKYNFKRLEDIYKMIGKASRQRIYNILIDKSDLSEGLIEINKSLLTDIELVESGYKQENYILNIFLKPGIDFSNKNYREILMFILFEYKGQYLREVRDKIESIKENLTEDQREDFIKFVEELNIKNYLKEEIKEENSESNI